MTVKTPVHTANPVDIYVGNQIRARRIALGLSQEKVAAQLKVSFQQLQKYEKGANRVSASRLWQTASILGCPVADFFPPLDAALGTLVIRTPKIQNARLDSAIAIIAQGLGVPSMRVLLTVAQGLRATAKLEEIGGDPLAEPAAIAAE